MSKRDKFKKQCNQPSVVALFTGNKSAISSTAITLDSLEVTPMQQQSAESSIALSVLKELELTGLIETMEVLFL